MQDPRKDDLTYDSQDWTRFLTLAESKNLELASILKGFRCSGLRLHKGSQGFALRPDLDPNNSKWLTKTGYMIDRDKWLMPYEKEIIELLEQLEREV